MVLRLPESVSNVKLNTARQRSEQETGPTHVEYKKSQPSF